MISVGDCERYFGSFGQVTARHTGSDLGIPGLKMTRDAGRYPESETYLKEFASRIGHPLSRHQWIEARKFSHPFPTPA